MLHLSFLLLQYAVNWLQYKNEHDNVIVTENGRCAKQGGLYDLGRCISKI